MWALTKKQAEEIKQLEKRYNNSVTPETVLEFAKDPHTALHKRFEWSNTKAAYEYRLWQARSVLRVYVVMHVPTQKVIRGVVSLTPDRGKGGYTSIATVMSAVDKREQMLSDALAELNMFRRKYSRLAELSEVFEAIDHLQKSLRYKKASGDFV